MTSAVQGPAPDGRGRLCRRSDSDTKGTIWPSQATLSPRPYTVGLAYANGYVPWLAAQAHDVPLDAILNDNGVVWPFK